jgi:oligopeptide transport system permease protein
MQPPDVSWGLLVNEHEGDQPHPDLLVARAVPWPGVGVTLLRLSFLGDGLQDALDPRLKNR